MLPEPEPAAPPLVLQWLVVAITRPQPPPVSITLPPSPAVIAVEWPRVRVTGAAPPCPPRVIRLAAPPQGPWRMRLPGGLVYMLAHPIPARAAEP